MGDAQRWKGSIVGKFVQEKSVVPDAAKGWKELVGRDIAHRWQGAEMPGVAQRGLSVQIL